MPITVLIPKFTPTQEKNPKHPRPRKRRSKLLNKIGEDDQNDANENSITSDDDETMPVAGPSRTVSRKRVLSGLQKSSNFLGA